MRLAELVGTLSLAADAGIGSPDETALRVAAVAARIGAQINAEPADRSAAFYLAMLRFIGCTADTEMAVAFLGDEVEFGAGTQGVDYGNPSEILGAMFRQFRQSRGAIGGLAQMIRAMSKMPGMTEHMREHCEVADLLAGRLGFDAATRAALVQNGERWDGTGGPNKLRGEAIAKAMRIAQVACETEMGYRFGAEEGIRARLRKMRGKALDPALCDQVVVAAEDIATVLGGPSAWTTMMQIEPAPHREITGASFDEAIATIAAFTDLKSRYTRNHSTAVAALAAAAAQSMGLAPDVVDDVRRAGLLHDLGRVAISGAILDKISPLTDVEREKIRMHAYVGERVLARATSLARAAEIASLAHERMDGAGYHRRLSASHCPPAARILAVADVYTALVEDRPHRSAFSPTEAAAEIVRMVEKGALCPDATRVVLTAAGHTPKKVDRPAGLTDREVEILRLLARGLTNKEIASALDISTKTAGNHIQHIFQKLNVTTRSGATICAMKQGLTA